MKRCTECHEVKELSEFYMRPLGPRSECKLCTRTHNDKWFAANKERRRASIKKYDASRAQERAAFYKANRPLIRARRRAYILRHPDRAAWSQQKSSAKKRGIVFVITLEEWVKWWGDDLAFRGRRENDLNMCRFNDEGPYALNNIYKASQSENREGPRPVPQPSW